jgi:hydroxyacylglutathione hydrolase
MKKFLKRILWGLVIIIGLIFIAGIAFYINFRKATKSMTPAQTEAINDSVWCIKDKFVNAYIFKGKNSYLIIDAGISKRSFASELKKLKINPDNITTLLLTHTDSDHTGAIPLLRNAVIYMHHDEEQMINGTTGKTKYIKTKWEYGPYRLLESNDTLIADGLKIKILHTPGHTPGSSCYIIGSDYLVTGDNVIVKDGKYEPFTEMFNMNTLQQLESIKTLPPPASFKYILTGHYGIVRI